MTPATPGTCRWFTRLCYGLLWVIPLAIGAGLAVAIDRPAGAVLSALVVVVVLWRLLRVGLFADDDRLIVRTVTRSLALAWSDVESLFWRAPRILGGDSSDGLDTRNVRLSARRKDGAEVRLPAIVGSPAGADRVQDLLRRWTVPAGVAFAPLVERDLRRPR